MERPAQLVPDNEIERLIGRLGKEGQEFLRERFRQIRKSARPDEREMLHYKVLSRAEVIQQASQFTFSRWCSSKAELERDDAQRLLEYLVEQGLWDEVREQLRIARAPDQYFWSLVHELESARTTRQKLKSGAPAVYQLWRPAVAWPGRYVLGMLIVYYHVRTGAMRTIEFHRMQGEAAGPGGLLRTPRLTECLRGYLVKKSSQLIMHSFQQGTRNMQITVLADLLQQNRQIHAMSGLCLGLMGQRGLYCRPVVLMRQAELSADMLAALDGQIDEDGWPTDAFMTRLNADPLFNALNIVESADVPEFVKERLAESASLSEFKHPDF
ncbi:hypothetical protein [Chitinimonas sp.]|uniref:hypothetical protein n=1 Tax=Chitinimonas sp. TaxID=1934313 RepID=UPI0035B1F5AF